jgi:hypothetical protein
MQCGGGAKKRVSIHKNVKYHNDETIENTF